MTLTASLSALLPEALSHSSTAILIVSSFFTALMTATIGIGGGMLLLAIMANMLPALAIIPIHGLVQASANGNRALITRNHIHPGTLADFTSGALVGAAVASLLVIQLPVQSIQLSVAVFVLYLTWGPPLKLRYLSGWPLRTAAATTTLISMFVGASGPMVAAFVKQISNERFARVATFSACMAVQHSLKLVVFGLLGFAFQDWIGLIVLMILSGFAGTWVGLHLLSRLNNRVFDYAFKVVLSMLACKLLIDGLIELS